MVNLKNEFAIRLEAFRFLRRERQKYGDVLPWEVLRRGFEFHGKRVPLVSPQGIFKPRVLDFPLTIRTTAPNPKRPRPYDDGFDDQGLIHYRYRGTDPHHPDNIRLRATIQLRLPLIYLHGVAEGWYQAIWPILVVADNPSKLSFVVSPEHEQHVIYTLKWGSHLENEEKDLIRREYVASEVKRRLHQGAFRMRVLNAYRNQCTICQLKHPELLEAAHIIPDSEEAGEPIVSNGLSMCRLHHAAFDKNIVGIRPDYKVEIRQDILEEEDGPMLRHGLQEMHGHRIIVPKREVWKPNPEFLEERYEEFIGA